MYITQALKYRPQCHHCNFNLLVQNPNIVTLCANEELCSPLVNQIVVRGERRGKAESMALKRPEAISSAKMGPNRKIYHFLSPFQYLGSVMPCGFWFLLSSF